MGRHWNWAPCFLAALERSGSARASARAIGVGRRTAYDRRTADDVFHEAWDAALRPFADGSRPYDGQALEPLRTRVLTPERWHHYGWPVAIRLEYLALVLRCRSLDELPARLARIERAQGHGHQGSDALAYVVSRDRVKDSEKLWRSLAIVCADWRSRPPA